MANFGWGTSEEIVAREAAKVASAQAQGRVPIPSEETRKGLEALGFEFGEPVDRVLISVKFPKGYKHVTESRDPRHGSIVGPDGKAVASIFLKNSGYDYYGNIFLCEA